MRTGLVPLLTFRPALALVLACLAATAHGYENFKVAVYCRAYEVREMADPAWLDARWRELSTQVHVDRIYLETHRDLLIVDDRTLEAAKAFFRSKGVAVAGGITFTVDESNRFETFDYANPEHRKKVREIVEHTARHFDEIILDDFFFTSTKSEHDLRARGSRSWTDFRLELMAGAAQDLVVGPAKAVNPKAKVIIKYPNWYEHFQALGFNLEKEPAIFDRLYTGTETRDAVHSAQHLQPYHGYSIMQYFSNLAPGRNGGGWVDTGGARYYDRYAEQLWVTLLARAAPEITLFDLRQMHLPLSADLRAPWQDQHPSFRYDAVRQPFAHEGVTVTPTSYARVAGVSFEAIDGILGRLGRPVALKSYKPFHSSGEDYLQSYLGMIGLPMEIVPQFPTEEPVVLLTQLAAADSEIVAKIERHLRSGRKVIITSGLLKALADRGLRQIAEIEDTGRVAFVQTFQAGRGPTSDSARPILIPQIGYRTNDSWELVSALAGDNGWPLLHDADYATGHLYVLTIPENFADLYEYPDAALNEIRRILTPHLPVHLEAPSKVSLFAYDNGTFVVENFRDETVRATAVLPAGRLQLEDLSSGELLAAGERRTTRWPAKAPMVSAVASFELPPHSFRAFQVR
jgi:hypothetical protein